MVIECSSCRARYRMKQSMLKGFRGAEVRCRKCGGKIVLQFSETQTVGKGRTVGLAGTISPKASAADPIGRKDPPPGRTGKQPKTAEAKVRIQEAVPEEMHPFEAVRENVFSLDLFRGSRPRKSITGGFDISGAILSEPALSLEEQEPPESHSTPLLPFPEFRKPEVASLLDKPILWQNEGIASSPEETSPPSPDQQTAIEEYILRKTLFNAKFSNAVSPRPSHVLMVYLYLLFLGGCGYLILHFLSGIMNAGGQ